MKIEIDANFGVALVEIGNRGESAFCSAECRQQQMNLDEAKEKCSMVSKKGSAAVASTPAAVSKVSAIFDESLAAV